MTPTPTPTRRNAATIRRLILTLTLGLIALVIVALACGPSAPAGQDGAPEKEEPTATPTFTPTLTPTHTPTPAPTPLLLSAVTETMLRLTEQAVASPGSGGVAGTASGPQLPEKIRVTVNTHYGTESALEQFLINNGAPRVRVMDDGVTADVPPLLLGKITQHPSFRSGFSAGLYYKVYPYMDEILTRYAAGELTALEAANEIRVARVGGPLTFPRALSEALVPNVLIVLTGPESSAAVRAYLTANGSYLDPKVAGETEFYADVPVPAFDSLHHLSGVAWIQAELLPLTPQPGEPSSRSGVTGQSHRSAPTPTPQGAAAHGANVWHNADDPITGDGVSIGIIDLGFYKFGDSMESGQLPAANKVHYNCPNRIDPHLSEGTGVPPASCSGYSMHNDEHGTMVAEAVYDVAPDATLYISNLPRPAAAA